MGCDRSISEATGAASAASEAAPGRHVCYVEPAPLTDVMLDQLEYLLAHKSQTCAAECEACHRLKQVQGWLLLPFRSVGYRKPPAPAAAA